MAIRQCIGLNSKQCTDFSTKVSQLCPKCEKELDKKLAALDSREKDSRYVKA